MVFQPADELHGALGEPLDGFLKNGQPITALVFGLLVAIGQRFGFALGLGLVVDARFAKDFLFHEGHEVVGQAQQAGLTGFRIGGAAP